MTTLELYAVSNGLSVGAIVSAILARPTVMNYVVCVFSVLFLIAGVMKSYRR